MKTLGQKQPDRLLFLISSRARNHSLSGGNHSPLIRLNQKMDRPYRTVHIHNH